VVSDVTKIWDNGNLVGRCGFDLPGSFAVDRQAFSAFAVCEAAVSGGLGTRFAHATDSGYTCLLMSDGTTGKIGGYDGTAKLGGVQSVPSNSRCLIGWVGGTGALKIWRNDAIVSATALGSGSATLTGLMYDPAGTYSSGHWAVRDWLFYDKALSDAEVNNTILPWAVTRGVTTSFPQLLLCVGDSITEGYGPACNRNWPSRMLFSGPQLRVCAQIGSTAASLQAAIAPTVLQMAAGDVVCIWAGTNDVTGGITAAVTYASLTLMASQFRNLGARIALVTPLPHGVSTLTGEMAALRALILANAIGAEVVADPWANASIATHWTDGTYDWDDIHLNDAGNALCAQIIRAAISPLIAGGSGGSPPSRRFFEFR
jgi:lysophospholipase L1-like esterase